MTREQAAEQISRLARHLEERGYGYWAAEDKATGAFIGRIGLLYQEDWPEGPHKTDVGWLLDRPYLAGTSPPRCPGRPAPRL